MLVRVATYDAAERRRIRFDVTRAIFVRATGVIAGKVSVARAHRLDTGPFVSEYEAGWWLHPESPPATAKWRTPAAHCSTTCSPAAT